MRQLKHKGLREKQVVYAVSCAQVLMLRTLPNLCCTELEENIVGSFQCI